MNSIVLLQTQLENARLQLSLPEVKGSIKPVSQDRGWILSSDICLLLARRMAQGPDKLADQFLTLLPETGEGRWSRIAGYLVFSLSETSDFAAEYESTYSPALPLRIFVPKRDDRHSPASFVRLASLAILEGLWAIKQGVPVELDIAGVSLIETVRSGKLVDVIERVVECSQSDAVTSTQITASVLSFLGQDSAARYSLFLAPGDIDLLLFKKGAELLPFDEQVSVTIPDQGWMSDVDAVPSEFRFLDHLEDGAYSLLLHLASNSRGVDIEWRSPEFLERKNLIWLLRSSISRLESLTESVGPDTGRDRENSHQRTPEKSGFPFESAESHFILRFLPLFYERAVYYGEVSALVPAALTACESISATLNRPDFRLRLETGDPNAHTQLSVLKAYGRLLNNIFFDVD